MKTIISFFSVLILFFTIFAVASINFLRQEEMNPRALPQVHAYQEQFPNAASPA
jgi:hypothetical protein